MGLADEMATTNGSDSSVIDLAEAAEDDTADEEEADDTTAFASPPPDSRNVDEFLKLNGKITYVLAVLPSLSALSKRSAVTIGFDSGNLSPQCYSQHSHQSGCVRTRTECVNPMREAYRIRGNVLCFPRFRG